MELSLKQLKKLIETLEEGGISEFEYQDDKYRVRLALGRGAPAAAAGPTPGILAAAAPLTAGGSAVAASEASDPNLVFVTSPFVGTFYRAAGPDSEPFVEAGRAVKKGQTLCIVEAMKLMNEIEAEVAGTILEVLVENGASVEFGQKLFKVLKS
jgi:acetyl-CoA carboxylase biotin carboxyl carrier protein